MITSDYLDAELIDNTAFNFKNYNDFIDPKTGLKLFSYPFRSLVLPNFIQDSDFLTKVKDAVQRTELYHKSNDLYEFYQSNDLKSSEQSCIKQLLHSLFSPNWIQILSQITGFQLSNTIDVACQKYPQNGFLLCHDDDMGDAEDSRKIAFILYLVDPSWSASHGGQLQLFNTNEKGQPKDIVRNIVPQWNHFAFFEVTSTSFHQVQEVYSSTDRLSIAGWFHGPKESIPAHITSSCISFQEESDLEMWINPVYLSDVSLLNTQFAKDSFLCLKSFIKQEMDQKLESEIMSTNSWKRKSVANSFHYSILDFKTESGLLFKLYSLFKSNQFQSYLCNVTGMEIDAVKHMDCRSFECGDYTLVKDDELPEPGLDVVFSMSTTDNWDVSCGGQLHYIYQEETLLSLLPSRNELFLCFRDDQVLSFIRYMNAKSGNQKRREFAGLFIEKETLLGLE